MTLQRLAIIGASGHGKVVADVAIQSGWKEIFFFDDAWPLLKFNGIWPVHGDSRSLFAAIEDFDGIAIAIGNNSIRLEKFYEIENVANKMVVLRHPAAYIANNVFIGKGSVVFAGAIIQPETSIGVSCIVNTAATIDHDCLLKDGVHVAPGAHVAGGVSVGNCSWIGIGSTVNQNLSIGARVIVGAGAAVTNDIPDNTTVVGIPARPLKK